MREIGQGYSFFEFSVLLGLLLGFPSFSPDIFSSVSVPPSLKVCLDLSAEYLILSDVQRKVGCCGGTLEELGLLGKAGLCDMSQPLQPQLSSECVTHAGPLCDGAAAEPGRGPCLL